MWNGSLPQLKTWCCARYSPSSFDMRYKHHSRSPVLFRTGCYRFTSCVLFSQSSSCVWESPWPYLHFRTTTPGSTMLSVLQRNKAKNRNIESLPAWDRWGQTAVALPQTAQNIKSIFLLAENFRGCAVCLAADWSQGQLFEHPSWAST